jgi:DNA sulfur modification protein DndB
VSEAIKIAGKLPRTLDEKPFAGLMWDTSTQTILNAHKVTLRELLSYMVGCSTYSEERLIDRYSKALGVEETDLPDRVI